MKKCPIGFNTNFDKEPITNIPMEVCKGVIEPKKSVVKVYFPHRDMSWAYYNDQFDLKVGDFVFVEGKLEGYRGRVVEVNYSFKIKLSDYKKVVTVVDTNVTGEFYLAGTHIVSFDKNAIPSKKIRTWFTPPAVEDDIIISDDESAMFPLDDLSKMNISHEESERGRYLYVENKVSYIEVDGEKGYAIVEGSKNYEVEFNYMNGVVSNIRCSCFEGGTCRHEFAAMLQLKESLELITENYETEHNGYFAIISRGVFNGMIMNKKVSGKISLEG